MILVSEGAIQKTNTYQLIAERLVREIVESDLSAGEHVPTEREISERYGVGRSSVRESLRLLEAHQVIRPAPGGSYVVGSAASVLEPALLMLVALGGASLTELQQLRRVLEIEAVDKAVQNATPEDIRKLQSAVKRMIGNRRDLAAALRADLEFHVSIAEASGNRALLATVQGLHGVLKPKILGSNVDIDEAIAHHQLILAAIIARDPEEAREAIEVHMDFVRAGIEQSE